MVHTRTFGLKFGSLSPAMTLKIRSPKLNGLFVMSQCYIHANLVKIHPPVREISCKQESVNADANRIRTENNMPASPSVGDIIRLKFVYAVLQTVLTATAQLFFTIRKHSVNISALY